MVHLNWRTKNYRLNVLNQALGGGGTISEINSPVRLMP